MLDLAGSTTVYLACGVTDLRKSYNGLAAIIPQKHEISAVFPAISYIYGCCFFWIKPYAIWYNLSIRLQAGEQTDGAIVYKRTTQ